MKLISFTANSYRSIQTAYKVSLFDYTVLVGPNNEGKSNLLRGIVLSLNVLATGKSQRRGTRVPVRYSYRDVYRSLFDFDWKRDFPVQLQEANPEGRSEFTLEFALNDSDFTDFNQQVKANLNTNLKIKLSFGKDEVLFDIIMPGKGKKALNERKKEISDFIRGRLMVQYVSAIRPTDMAFRVVEDLIHAELQRLRENPDYQKAAKILQDLQQPVLDSVASSIRASMADFMPTVQSVSILPEEERYSNTFRREYSILIDDGVQTELSLKGDGVISLVTMSLMRHTTQASLGNRYLILGIEEPESHLHPRAIHQLKEVLTGISSISQVIITTHSPILVDRGRPEHNIVVNSNRAQSASHVSQIRESLGILVSDNLTAATMVLLVEGEDDQIVLRTLLALASDTIARALKGGTLVIEPLGGASKLFYQTQLYKNLLCNVHAFLDGDDEGKKAINSALQVKRLTNDEYTLATAPGIEECELEDLLNQDCYEGMLAKDFQLNLNMKHFKSGKIKWSDRIAAVAKACGKIWSPSLEMQIKIAVANAAAQRGLEALHSEKRHSFDALVSSLESRLQK